MYKLYYDAGASNMAAHAALEEIGAPYELVLIDTDKGEQKSEAYLKLNPHGRVPTLVHDDLVMYESAAILMYLCDRHPEVSLAPAIVTPQRALYLQWLFYFTNTVQETLEHSDHPEFFVQDETSQAVFAAEAERRLDGMWSHLDGVLSDGPYLLGDTFSACDLQLTMMVRWTRNMTKPATTFANIKRCFELVSDRPAWMRMMESESLT